MENFLRGINVSIFAYGQTSTGKTYTMKGTNTNLNGMIPLSIKEIISRLSEEEKKEGNGFKFALRASYLEIYNETVNDLLDSSKKNLEIRESLQKGVFINGLTEIPITNLEKAVQLLKQGDNVRVIAETKLNEKSSRSHTIFRLNLEVTRQVEGKQKTFISQLNLIDLAGSENVSKAKTEGIRMKEGSNINKSLLALSNVIQKLSTNPKTFVNYRDSKLTRLLQPALSGNSKTMIICTITENYNCYSETLNTLHFGNKAKNIKTVIKVNELMDEKSKIMLENTLLKNKIKQLEDLIIEKKASDSENAGNISKAESIKTESIKAESIKAESNPYSNVNSTQNNSQSNCTGNTTTSDKSQISALEKEVMLLKKILITNEEIGDADVNSVSNEILSTNSNHIYNNLSGNYTSNYNMTNQLHMSATKYTAPRQSTNSNILMSSGKKMTDSARKIYRRDDFSAYGMPSTNNYSFNEPEVTAPVTSSSIFRRCMTDMKMNSFAPSVYAGNSNFAVNAGGANTNNNLNSASNYLLSAQQKSKYPSSNQYISGSGYKAARDNFEGDFDFLCPSNDNSMQLLKENDELRKNLYDLRKNFLETVQNKDSQIKSLNFYLSTTNDNCEKLIREAEENYMNLKLNYDRTKEDVMNKDTEIKNLNQTIRNLEANANFYKEEINKLGNEIDKMNDSLKQDSMYRELEMKFAELNKNYDNLCKIYESDKVLLVEMKAQNEKLKSENSSLKMQVDNCKSESVSFKTQYDVLKKNNDLLSIENSKLKNDIESYKNEIATSKEKVMKMRSELNQLQKINDKNGTKDKKATVNGGNTNAKMNPKIEDLENKVSTQGTYILQLESQVMDYKNNLMKIEQTQIAEYQKLLDEAFAKISELQNELENSVQKNNYLEKIIKLNTGHKNERKCKCYIIILIYHYCL